MSSEVTVFRNDGYREHVGLRVLCASSPDPLHLSRLAADSVVRCGDQQTTVAKGTCEWHGDQGKGNERRKVHVEVCVCVCETGC